MTLTELRYIVAVAREGHFGKAAKKCFVSQPTLSLGIKKLEDELGILLFERGQKEVLITPIGRKIIKQAEQALKEISTLKEMARTGHDPLSAPVRLAAIYTVGPYLFPSLLPVIRDQSPEITLLIEENYTSQISDKLKRGEIDIGIVSLPYDEPGVDIYPLYEEPFVALLPSAHPLNSLTTVSPDELARETVLLLGSQHCFREQVLQFCPRFMHSMSDDDNLQATLEGGSLETIRYMVASGVGVTVLPTTAACAEKYSQRLVTVKRFRGLQPSRQIALVSRKNFSRSCVVVLIANAIRKCRLSGIRFLEKEPVFRPVGVTDALALAT